MVETRKIAGSVLSVMLVLAFPAGCRPEGNARPAGETVVSLSAARDSGPVSLEETLAARRSRRSPAPRPLSLEKAAQLLWAAQGVTEARRGLRTAPSAGATYPLETWLVAARVDGLEPGVYRYEPRAHRLELAREGGVSEALAAAALGQRWVSEAPAVIVLSAVYERTAARYGDRAERYTHMEAGHAGQNIYLQAEALGLATVAVGAFRDGEVKSLLGLECEPLYLYPVGHRAD